MINTIQFLYYILFLSLPFSIKWKLGSAEVSIPSEPIQILISLFLFTQYKTIYILLKVHISHHLLKLVILFLSLGFLSVTYSNFPIVTIKFMLIEAMHVIVFLVGFLLLYENNKKIIRQLTFCYTISFIILLIRGWMLHANYQFAVSFSTAALLPFFQDNPMWGATTALLLPLWIHEIFNQSKNKFSFVATYLASTLIALGAFTSFSRAVWLSVLVSFVFTFIIWIFHKNFLKQIFFLLFFIGSTIGIVYFIINSEITSSHIKNQNLVSQLLSSFNWKNDVSNMERLNRYKCALRIFKDYPFSGTGINTYKRTYLNYQQKNDMTRISVENIEVTARYGTGGDCHSEYFTVLSELGIPGFFIWLAIVAILFLTLIKNYNQYHQFHYTLFYFFSMSTFFLHIWVNNFMHEEKLSGFVWMIIGYAICSSSVSELESKE